MLVKRGSKEYPGENVRFNTRERFCAELLNGSSISHFSNIEGEIRKVQDNGWNRLEEAETRGRKKRGQMIQS